MITSILESPKFDTVLNAVLAARRVGKKDPQVAEIKSQLETLIKRVRCAGEDIDTLVLTIATRLLTEDPVRVVHAALIMGLHIGIETANGVVMEEQFHV